MGSSGATRNGIGRCVGAKGHGGQAAAPGIMGMRTLSPASRTAIFAGGFIGPDTADGHGRVSRTIGAGAAGSRPKTKATLP
jgi:hypothetical protein